MPDDLKPSDSSTDAGNLTAADVDFSEFQSARHAERLAEAGHTEPKKEPEPKAEAVAEPAPAKEADPPKKAAEAKPPTPLTREEIQREIDARLAAQPKVEPKKEEPKADPYPSLADEKFKTVEECERAQAEWIGRHTANAVKEALAVESKKLDEAREAQADIDGKKKAWEERETEAKARHKDYDELKKLGESRPFNETALRFIVDSKVGPDLLVHYVKNEQDWRDLIALPPEDIRLEMRMVEREVKRKMAETPAVKPKTVSTAPAPARQLPGSGSPADDPKEKAAMEGDMDSYSRIRNQERQRDTLGRFQ